MKLRYYWAAVCIALLVVVSCNKEDDFQIDYKYEYFPTDSGRYVIYDVDSIIWNDFFDPPQVDTISFQVRELYTDIFTSGSGQPYRRIERSTRPDSRAAWALADVWSATIDNNRAIWDEENLRFLKILFPPKLGQKWAGNQFINTNQGPIFLGDWEYEVTALDEPATINGLNFDSTLTVLLHADSNLIEKTYALERYAKGVGLVYKEWQWLTKDNVTAPFPEGTENGFIVRMRIRDYGSL